MTKPTFAELLEGAKVEASAGRGAVNCTYILAAQDKAYPRTCERCGLGPCPFSDRLMAAREKPTTPSREEAPERIWLLDWGHESCAWCADPNPDGQHEDSVAYVRADLANREPSEAITVDSSVYGQEFYGILNAQGQFWTPLAFDSEEAASLHIRKFWASDVVMREECLRTHRIVPVVIQLTAIPAPEKQP